MPNPSFPPHLMQQIEANDARLARIETRLVRLMIHMGLSPDGDVKTPKQQPAPQPARSQS